jgi:hypothetical protein
LTTTTTKTKPHNRPLSDVKLGRLTALVSAGATIAALDQIF